MKQFKLSGIIEGVPAELAGLDAGEEVEITLYDGNWFPLPAGAVVSMFEAAASRHARLRFSIEETAALLSDQFSGYGFRHWMGRIVDAHMNGQLEVFDYDGAPYQWTPKKPMDDGPLGEHNRRLKCEQLIRLCYTTKDAINDWLQTWDGGLQFMDGANQTAPKKSTLQNDAILDTIRELGHDPKALPTRPNGKRGVKADAKELLDGKPPFEARTAFDEAWKQLLKLKEISEV